MKDPVFLRDIAPVIVGVLFLLWLLFVECRFVDRVLARTRRAEADRLAAAQQNFAPRATGGEA